MDFTGSLEPKCVILLTHSTTASDEVRLPEYIHLNYVDRLEPEFVLSSRNGYKIPVIYDKERGAFKGMSNLYLDYSLKGGEYLVFECYGHSDLNFYVVGQNGSEFEYPGILNDFQMGFSFNVPIDNAGVRFLKFLHPDVKVVDEIDVPPLFVAQYGSKIDKFPSFVLSNGQKFCGRYSPQNNKLSGLRGMAKRLRLHDLNSFHMLLFTYYPAGLFHIAAFTESMVEIRFPGTPMSRDYKPDPVTAAGSFAITVQEFHLYKWSYGVDISAQFKEIWQFWGKTDYISVYSENKAWRLKIKIRGNRKRATIHDGWLKFRDDLDLNVGDVCVFECRRSSFNHFRVRVIKNE